MPIIGITTRVVEIDNKLIEKVSESLIKKVIEVGGIPIIIPYVNEKDINFFLELCDAFIIPGGFSWHNLDEIIIEYAIINDKPLLGICAGMQGIGNYKNFQRSSLSDKTVLIENKEHNSNNEYVHEIIIKGCMLKNILKEDKILVNSRHNSMIVNDDFFDIEAVSPDNVIEAIKVKNKRFILGVQWHPEDLDDIYSYNIFKALIINCK